MPLVDADRADPSPPPVAIRRRGRAIALALVLLAALSLFGVRKDLASRVITGQLTELGLPATYEIVRLGPRHQLLRNVVVGDPRRPDFTAREIETWLSPRLGTPVLRKVRVSGAQIDGSYRGGKLSFGSLDKLLFGPGGGDFRLPRLDVEIVGGRARLLTDYGPVGARIEGRGNLRDGFAGMLAIAAPRLAAPGCAARDALFVGRFGVAAERPRLAGPLTVSALDCPSQKLRLARGELAVDGLFSRKLDGFDGTVRAKASRVAYAGNRAAGIGALADLAWHDGEVSGDYAVSAVQLVMGQVAAQRIGVAGKAASRNAFTDLTIDGRVQGAGIATGSAIDATLAQAQRAGVDTLIAPLVAQMRGALAREGRASAIDARFAAEKVGPALTITVPEGRWSGTSGATLLALSDMRYSAGNTRSPVLSGAFESGGAGLPRIVGDARREGGGNLQLRLAMDTYRAGGSSLDVPELVAVRTADGALGFAGRARMTGPLPGGRAEALDLPIDGNWSRAGALSLWRGCVPLRFDRLAYANLTLDRRALTLCPVPGRAIVSYDGAGLRIAAGAPELDVTGRLGSTPLRLRSGPVGFAYPGTLAARRVDVALGPVATASRFSINDLTARIGQDIAGRFAGSDVRLAAVPLDLRGANGAWRYAGGRLSISGADFRLVDRQAQARFQPMVARDAALTLFDNRVTATATMREPRTDREVVAVAIRHDLTDGTGHADLAVDGILFDRALQPDDLTLNARGVIANARGLVHGRGTIDWNARGVTSGGAFTSDSFDFAAAFGPVRGASGTVVFTDLLGMVTAPDQQLRIASVNPGIEVEDGILTFQLERDNVLQLKGVTWPFLGGRMTLLPVRMQLGKAETRRYVLKIEGLDAAKFVARMQLSNLGATGTFDGTLPLVFDDASGRIEGGLLVSRPPGGNVSYVGALTYKDLTPIANFAFDALKSLDFKEMRIGMDGNLTGEIVTRVRFDGVKQGAAAKQNFITRRFANLPIQFNVNVRAPFYQLITSFRSMSDPAFVKDPRTVGLIGPDGQPLRPAVTNPPPPPVTPADIQPSDSRKPL